MFLKQQQRLGRPCAGSSPASLSSQCAKVASTRRVARSSTHVTMASCAPGSDPTTTQLAISKRASLLTLLASSVMAASPAVGPAIAAGSAEAGAYLPRSGVDDLVTYIPAMNKTPALRAGVITSPYTILVPPTWKEAKIPNILTGNFCMPRCGEPWVEVVYEEPSQGKMQLFVSPLVKLTNKANVPVQDLGSPESILPRIGGYITGTVLEDEDFVASYEKVQDDGLTYYYYELYAPTANGHSLTAVTAKGEGLYLLVCSAQSDKAWRGSEAKLRKVVEGFRA